MPLVPVEYDPFMAEGTAAAVNERSALDAVPRPPSFGRADTWPAQLGRAVLGAVTLPHDVMTGQVDPLSDEGIARATNLAGLDVGSLADAAGAIGRRLIPVDHDPFAVASRSPRMYNPPTLEQRSFEADYPASGGSYGQPGEALATDIEGRPLGARWIVGRNTVMGEDVPFPTADLDALTTAGTGRGAQVAPPSQMGRDVGRTVLERFTRRPLGVFLRSDLTPEERVLVHAHENGHVIDELAGQVPTTGLSKELGAVYNTLNNPTRNAAGTDAVAFNGTGRTRPVGPRNLGYSAADAPREMMVEAIRAYMTNPNWFKKVAPNTAKAIRAAVNAHPQLSKIIQFNAATGAGLALPAAAGAAGVTLAPVDHDPFAELATDPNGA